MRSKISLGLVLALIIAALTAQVALGADILTKNECIADGGIYTNDRGVKTCTTWTEETVVIQEAGSSGNAWTADVTTTTTESQKGAIGSPGTSDTYDYSSDSEVTACWNPGGQPMDPSHQHCQP